MEKNFKCFVCAYECEVIAGEKIKGFLIRCPSCNSKVWWWI